MLYLQLVYTTAIAVTCVFAATIIVAGAFESKLFGGPLMWAGLSCTFSIVLRVLSLIDPFKGGITSLLVCLLRSRTSRGICFIMFGRFSTTLDALFGAMNAK